MGQYESKYLQKYPGNLMTYGRLKMFKDFLMMVKEN
ncbi:hypothetical protein SAMN05880580_104219 [Priestia flexa]|nr:hypothetical protein SAMN05880580_104219 [Priestia flexa]